MRKTRNSSGFTMAEMLIVVAIILVLAGVAFIAVQNHQRSMAQLERNAIAKELFVAAQNHLTMAESEGYSTQSPEDDFFGTKVTETDKDGKPAVAYYVVGPSAGNILDQMLPFGSIDETVRAGGSYLIHYQTNPARIMDVFYVTTSGSPERFNKSGGIGTEDYDELMEKKDNLPTSGYVLGYYGGEEALLSGEIIFSPTVEVENGERLIVKVIDTNNNNVDPAMRNGEAALKLIITGETSKAKLAIALTPATSADNNRFYYSEVDMNYTVILDDITSAAANSPYDTNVKDGLHFADLNAFKGSAGGVLQFWQNDKGETPLFLPGENITVQAVSYSNTALTNIAYSSARITNSLFADSQPADVASTSETSTNVKAMIGNFRHMENLDAAVSGLPPTLKGPEETLVYTEAEQIVDLAKPETVETGAADLSWMGFVDAIKSAKGSNPVKIYTDSSESTGTADDCYRPVDLTYALEYKGNHHKIEGVKVDYAQDAGMFGTISAAGSKVHDLKLVDFSITTSSGDAGALVGKLTQDAALASDAFNISNVVAYHTDGKADSAKITSASGNAGGLIGQTVGGNCKVEKSAAALIVKSDVGNAGGLIGISDGGTVSGCYAGGHTKEDTTTKAVLYDSTNFNITAARAESATTGGIAGGLIGDAGSTEIKYSYSTCSAKGVTVGGLIGTGSGAITSSYCTGKVSGTTQGAFAGSWTYTDQEDDDGNGYLEIINEQEEKNTSGNPTGGYTYLYPIPASETVTGIKAIDETAQSYNEFCGASTEWKGAIPYDTKLKEYYGGKYNLQSVEQLAGTLKADDNDTTEYFVATHYGDWPAPEIFVVNTPNS